MIENNKFREIITGIVREEIKVAAEETDNIIAEIVRAELIPGLRAAIRESIAKELGCAASDEHATFEGRSKEEIKTAVSPGDLPPQKAAAEEVEATIDARDDQGLYLYGLADTNVSARLGKVGIDGCEVYTIPHEGISAIVHNSPLEPYKSDDDETVKIWVKTHQQVLDIAAERFGNIMPFGFDTIITPKDNATAKDALKKWLSDEHEEIMRKMDRIKGKMSMESRYFTSLLCLARRLKKRARR